MEKYKISKKKILLVKKIRWFQKMEKVNNFMEIILFLI